MYRSSFVDGWGERTDRRVALLFRPSLTILNNGEQMCSQKTLVMLRATPQARITEKVLRATADHEGGRANWNLACSKNAKSNETRGENWTTAT